VEAALAYVRSVHSLSGIQLLQVLSTPCSQEPQIALKRMTRALSAAALLAAVLALG
jgi:hypothetical protein